MLNRLGLLMVMMFALVACQGEEKAVTKETTTEETTTEETTTEETTTEETTTEQPGPITDTPLSYLNSLREYAGLTHYTENSLLATAAMGHTDYQLNENVMGHDQFLSNSDYFTGEKPSDRAKAAGYASWSVSENISFNKTSANTLIDDLMTAIYHRMSLLDFDRDEIGFGFKVAPNPTQQDDPVWGVLTTKSGLAALETLCFRGEDITSGYRCANDKLISTASYDLSLSNVRAQSDEFAVWPAPGSIVPPVFYEESPDPLPACSVSGNPVSVQINPANLQDYTLFPDTFVLKDTQAQTVELLQVLTNETDQPDNAAASWQTPDKEWLAAFPKQRLAWGETYTAAVNYQYGGITQTLQWSFSTRSLEQAPYVLTQNTSQTKTDGETFYVYIPPENCNSNKHLNVTSVSYFEGQTPQVEIDAIDSQTYRIKVSDLSEANLYFAQSEGAIEKIENADSNEPEFYSPEGKDIFVTKMTIILE